MDDKEIIISLMEGGNATAINRETGEAKEQAQKMDMSRVQRSILKKEFIETFSKLNDLVKKSSGSPIWNNFNVVKSGVAFNGSSNAMFSDEISDEEFKKYKPKVGDIDITVPRNRMEDLFDVLKKSEDKKIGNIEYVGSNRKSASDIQQINAVFKYEVPNSDYVAFAQVDFEPSDYENDAPTEWDSFSHNSDWADIQQGFKGVNHKYALTIMAHIVSKDFTQLPSIMVERGADKKTFYTVTPATAKKFESVSSRDLGKTKFDSEEDAAEAMVTAGLAKKPPKSVLKKSKAVAVSASHYLAFSVGKGLRIKYASLKTKDDKPIMIDGKMVLIALDSKGAESETNLTEMFKLFFGFEPTTAQLKQMNSFVGVIELLKKSKLPDRKKDYEQFLDELITQKLWGHPPYHFSRSQELERDSKEIDAEIKWSMVNYIMKELKVGNLNEIKKIANSYYDSWQGGAGDDINEGFIPYGSKLSTIFEAVENQNKRNQNKRI